ncbi:MAG TPA: nitrous oxide reductase accessory protein NosL [Candidatus Deferrimicrobiaceae bacterium]
MTKPIRTLFLFPFLSLVLAATAMASSPVEPPQKCEQCGMDRERFAYSRMIVEYADGSKAGVCSIHCAAADMAKGAGKAVKTLRVADYNTREILDANIATWVVGGKAKGVMTGVPKWAFADRKEALTFVKAFGGKVTPFKKVFAASKAEVAEWGR